MKPLRPSLNTLALLNMLAVLLGACQPAVPSVDFNAQVTQAVQTALVSIRETQTASTASATDTPNITPTAART